MNDYGWSYDDYPIDIRKMLSLSDYESPISGFVNSIADSIDTQLENDVCNVCMSYGITVNPDELIKALNNDRKQYEKGYLDACRRYGRPVAQWVKSEVCPSNNVCSNCQTIILSTHYNYCPNCGAEMRKSDDSNRISDNDEED